MFKTIFNIIFAVIFGVLGALVFTVFLLPYALNSSYFQNYQFVKDLKQGKIVINKTEQVYIQENKTIEEAVLRVQNSIVAIENASLKTITSGFVATSDGSVITLASAIPASGKFNVFLQGEPVDVEVVKIDSKNNLALLKISKDNLPTLGFADSNNVALGQKVFLVAPTSVKKDNWLVNEGIVKEIALDSIKTNMVENGVVAGSPLFNVASELVGLNFIDSKGNVSAISVNKIRELLGL